MNNPFAGMGGGTMPGPLGNAQVMVQSFMHFANNFRGDPKQKVQELLNSGRMSQDQYNALQIMGRQLWNMIPK